ncbi:hypothetical protein RD110_09620 [Rhodoferax koreense]|uniref:Uncharacterized protein n=1 Tax=Rhodoferax koreensis TaxID=1842727 RepID=A0A1P8JUI3_9BURK|nr:hypothetical protein [Rhodoferax koreense]APW37414.1 hypothetical protein RD110_09620 [Rhodoferax koreense]
MPLNLLQELARAPLPRSFTHPADIDRVMVCREAGFIDANIPPVARGGSSYAEGAAIVTRIRPLGYEALARHLRERGRTFDAQG